SITYPRHQRQADTPTPQDPPPTRAPRSTVNSRQTRHHVPRRRHPLRHPHLGPTIGRHDLDEQREIADYLDAETAKIDALISKAERFIELAQERRAALITAAVTGQIEIPAED
ncbi:hypothetical protein ACWEED_05605, partial [Micrococcus luteus]